MRSLNVLGLNHVTACEVGEAEGALLRAATKTLVENPWGGRSSYPIPRVPRRPGC